MALFALQAQPLISAEEAMAVVTERARVAPAPRQESVRPLTALNPAPRTQAEPQAPAEAEGWREALLDAMLAVGLICDSPECVEHDD
ncbi:hypothetical protein RQP53_22270 [Paucibacter sp. APW11]|uniref:Uncharacterized protein n=1 Tax=Roseateles aquae TaxID=3077235 RepID=A0ABU3PHG5_9BURK|nr:hypothetical protein [Paucibacter sp. APW11]MDT9002020.1 hypothetical protein [Paucibacter sp. APW11]